ncbi:glycosyltransferase family 21 protein [Panus rudis PR-1116 ss-1]|nr:glycosyltransferase family 21 protein [Panus rudis PR-1116 ss-1]
MNYSLDTPESLDPNLAIPNVHSNLGLTFATASLLWYTFVWSLGIWGCWNARKRYRLRPRSPLATAPSSEVPGVSILRPLKGLDVNLYENLESTFRQEYPNYEIFLCVDNEHDQALSVVRDLMAKYPHVNAHIAVGGETVGVNPKVNNLMQAYRQAKHDILWVLDSNVMVDPGTLARAVDALEPPPAISRPVRKRIAVVHHVPFAFMTEPTLGARIEEAFLNTNHAKMYIAINAVGVDSCVVGKSNLYRKSDLERVDGTLKPHTPGYDYPYGHGLAAFGRFLAEDNMIAGALWHELDLRHDLSCDVARNAVGNMSLSDYIWRRIRWIRVRKHMVLAATLLEPFTESIVAGVLASIGLQYLIGFPKILFLVLHFIAWLIVDLDVYASLAGHPVPSGLRWWSFVGAWSLRECLALPIWSYAIWGSTVSWRGGKYMVLRNGEVESVGQGGRSGERWWRKWFGTKESEPLYEPLELSHN